MIRLKIVSSKVRFLNHHTVLSSEEMDIEDGSLLKHSIANEW